MPTVVPVKEVSSSKKKVEKKDAPKKAEKVKTGRLDDDSSSDDGGKAAAQIDSKTTPVSQAPLVAPVDLVGDLLGMDSAPSTSGNTMSGATGLEGLDFG